MAVTSYVPPSALPSLSLPVLATDILIAQRGATVGQVPASALAGGGSGSAGAVLSVFGRSGIVTAQSNDYAIGQISGAGSLAQQNAGAVAITGGAITGMPAPTQPADVATKSYVDTTATVSSVFGRTGAVTAQNGDYNAGQISGLGTMATQNASAVAVTGGTITGLPTPVVASGAAIKSYVDNLVYTVYPSGGDDTANIQAAHDACENALGGVVTLVKGAQYICNEGLIWDPRLVALEGNGATLNFAGIVPGNVGTNLVTGDNSTFTTTTGSWTFTNATGFVAIQTVTIGGTVTPTDTLTVTATSSSITGSPINMTYTVVAGDTIASIVAGLVAVINATAQMIAHGVTSVAAANGTQLCIYITQHINVPIAWSVAKSGGATETITGTVNVSTPTGMLLKNTTGAQGTAALAMTTVPGTCYCVNYEMHVETVAQINVAAQISAGANALNFCANQTNTWFTFIARATTTYLQAKVSEPTSGDAGTIGNVTVQVGVPPLIWHWDRSNLFAHAANAGSGYAVGDILTVLGGSPSVAATIVVGGVDGSGHITYAQISNDGTYGVGNFPANPVSTSGGSGAGATFNIGISSPQFGHEAYPVREFLIVGPGRSLTYTVDAVSEFALYSGASASFGIMLNSPEIVTRNSTSSRGTIRNVDIRNCTVAGAFINQAYLVFPDEIGISSCNLGWITTNGENAGENIVVSRGSITGSDLLVVLDSASLKFDKTSMDYPRQAMYRINGKNAILTLNEVHEEYAPPGAVATGSIAFGTNPSNNDTITLSGVTWTFVTGAATGNQTQIQASTTATMTQLAADLGQINNSTLVAANYTTTTTVVGPALAIAYKIGGTAGNAYTLAASAGTPSAATLTGGFTNVSPITLTGTASQIFKQGGEHQVGLTFPRDAYPQLYLTSSAYQNIIWKDVAPQNMQGYTEFLSGPAIANIASPSRLGQFPTIMRALSNAAPRSNFLDIFGQGGFELPLVASSTVPNGLVFLTSSLDEAPPAGNNPNGFSTAFSARNVSGRGSLVVSTAAAHSGAQSLAVTKLVAGAGKLVIYLLAPCKSGYQHWWDFQINVPAPGTPGGPGASACVINVTQDYTQLAGAKLLYAATSFPNQVSIAAGFSPYLTGLSAALGQVFNGAGITAANPPGGTLTSTGGLQISNQNGTNGWQRFLFDTFNHGYQKCPAWADHVMLKIDITNLTDAATWNAASGVSFFLDDVYCWQF